MDLEKHRLIEQRVLSVPIESKPSSDKWAGVYVFGDERPFIVSEHEAAIHSFFAFSAESYPLYFFINQSSLETSQSLLARFPRIQFIPIDPLRNSFEYNYWFINRLWEILPDHPYCLTFQNDGFLLRPGYERYVEDNDFDYIGAPWDTDIRLKTKWFDLPPVRVGNGGMSARKPEKMREILKLVNGAGSQMAIVQGQYNGGVLRLNSPYCAEDAFFSSFGFGMNILKPVSIDEANKFSREPIPFGIIGTEECPFAFHRCDA